MRRLMSSDSHSFVDEKFIVFFVLLFLGVLWLISEISIFVTNYGTFLAVWYCLPSFLSILSLWDICIEEYLNFRTYLHMSTFLSFSISLSLCVLVQCFLKCNIHTHCLRIFFNADSDSETDCISNSIISWWCWCCQPVDHTLSSKVLAHFLRLVF